jgi:two-component system response regulator YesN
VYKVLIVDDEDLFREYLKTKILWENYGFHVYEQAKNGSEAFKIVQTQTPDLVFLDINMPLMDGIELSKKIKECSPATRIIIVSGYSEFEYARRAVKIGVDDYILKPFSRKELVEAVERAKCKLDSIMQNMADPAASALNNKERNENIKRIVKLKTKAGIHLEEAISYIKKNYGNRDLSIELIAGSLFITPVYLRKIFQHCLGISVIDFIINERLYKAKEMIEQNRNNIRLSEIALSVGYNDSGYFGRCFKKKFGISPGKYENLKR